MSIHNYIFVREDAISYKEFGWKGKRVIEGECIEIMNEDGCTIKQVIEKVRKIRKKEVN